MAKLSYPPRELWPERIYSLPELSYPDTLNACHELLDVNLEHGRGASPAIYFNHSVVTYSQLRQEVMEMAGALRQRGIGPGDRVILRLLNRPHFITTLLAVLRIGAVAVPTPPLIRAREISVIFESSGPTLLVAEADLWEEVEKLDTNSVPCVNVESLRGGQTYHECGPTSKDDLAVLLYTSGSTGVPKGCMHSHADLLAIADSYARYVLEPTSADRFGGHPTMAFAYGLGALLVFPLRFGASTVLLDRFTPEAMMESIRDYKVTFTFCAPLSLRMMMNQCTNLKSPLSSLRLAISAGETLPGPVYRSWQELTGVEVLDGLGSTEMLHIFISARPGRSRPGATGEVVPGYEAIVIDEKSMKPVPDGTEGLLAVKGPTGCRYLGSSYRQQNYVRRGWNIPGDVYIRDSEGFFHYQCRNDDIILCGGINIAGPEVEGVLAEHPAVSEVAVVASPDDLRGMVPKAFVVVRASYTPSEELKKDLQGFVRRELAPYKYPRKIEFVRELPKTSTGKVRRTELRRSEFQV